MRRQIYGYLPSRWASPPLDRYQIILLGDRGTCVNNLLKVVTWKRKAGSRTRDLRSRKSSALTITPPDVCWKRTSSHDTSASVYYGFLTIMRYYINLHTHSLHSRIRCCRGRRGSNQTNIQTNGEPNQTVTGKAKTNRGLTARTHHVQKLSKLSYCLHHVKHIKFHRPPGAVIPKLWPVGHFWPAASYKMTRQDLWSRIFYLHHISV